MATRHKITRKELKQPDEFQSVFETAALFFELHMTEVLLGVAALVVIVAVGLGVYYHEVNRGREAAARFEQALSDLQSGKYDVAEKELSSLAAEEPHRAVGRLANLFLATAYLGQKQPAKARDMLVRYLSDDAAASAFHGAALDDLAVAYEELGDYKQAENAYRQASDLEGPEQARAQLGMARMLQKQGKRAEAISVYDDFLAQHPYASERTGVMETLAQLGAPTAPGPRPPNIKLINPASVPPKN